MEKKLLILYFGGWDMIEQADVLNESLDWIVPTNVERGAKGYKAAMVYWEKEFRNFFSKKVSKADIENAADLLDWLGMNIGLSKTLASALMTIGVCQYSGIVKSLAGKVGQYPFLATVELSKKEIEEVESPHSLWRIYGTKAEYVAVILRERFEVKGVEQDWIFQGKSYTPSRKEAVIAMYVNNWKRRGKYDEGEGKTTGSL